MSCRLTRDVRLRARHEFVSVQSAGRRAAGSFFTILAQPNTLGRDRLGVVASKKLGNAVARNRAKRRVRELFRLTAPQAIAQRGGRPLDLVVIPRREVTRAPLALLTADFAAQLARLDRTRVS